MDEYKDHPSQKPENLSEPITCANSNEGSCSCSTYWLNPKATIDPPLIRYYNSTNAICSYRSYFYGGETGST